MTTSPPPPRYAVSWTPARPAFGCGTKSVSIFLLVGVAACFFVLIANDISIEAHSVYGLRDPTALRIVPLLLFGLVAWPIGHLIGIGYGVAAQWRRDERPWFGLAGICCNLLALAVWYVIVLDPLPPTANL